MITPDLIVINQKNGRSSTSEHREPLLDARSSAAARARKGPTTGPTDADLAAGVEQREAMRTLLAG